MNLEAAWQGEKKRTHLKDFLYSISMHLFAFR